MVDPSSGKSDAPRLRQRLRVALPIAMILAPRSNIILMILGGVNTGHAVSHGRRMSSTPPRKQGVRPTGSLQTSGLCGVEPGEGPHDRDSGVAVACIVRAPRGGEQAVGGLVAHRPERWTIETFERGLLHREIGLDIGMGGRRVRVFDGMPAAARFRSSGLEQTSSVLQFPL